MTDEEIDEDIRNDRETNLYIILRKALEKNGEFGKIKALVQTKILDLIQDDKNQNSKKSKTSPTTIDSDNKNQRDPLILLLNQLILEYFHWYGYQYSIEMFSTECQIDSNCPSRVYLESIFGQQYNYDVPILIQIIHKILENNKKTTSTDNEE